MLHLRVLRFALFSTAPMMLTESLHIREFLGLLRLKQRVMRLPKVSVFMVIREIRLSATNFPLTLHIKEITQFDCDIEGNGFDSVDCLELAQKLINDPISEAFRMLTSSFGVSGGDDE